MSVDKTSLYEDIIDTFKQGQGLTKGFYRWECDIYTPKEILKSMHVAAIPLYRDFENKTADILEVELALGLGDFIFGVYPYREQLRVTLYRIPVYPNTQSDVPDGSIVTQTFDATLWVDKNIAIATGGSYGGSRELANKEKIYPFKLQLFDKRTQLCRLYEFSGVVEDWDRESLLRHVLTIPDDINIVSIVPPSVVEKIEYENIPAGISIIDFPGWLQDYGGGVYNAGISWYFQKGQWFVFPCYDTTRFTTEEEVLTVCNIPQERMPTPESTYRIDGKQVYVLATGEVKVDDKTNSRQLSLGNGVRYGKANAMSSARDVYNNGEIIVDNTKNNVAVVGNQREDGLTIAPTLTLPTDNHAKALSKVAKQRGISLSFEWVNSDIGLLKPGMPARFFFEQNGNVQMLEGVVLRASQLSRPPEPGMAQRTHQQNATVTLFLDNNQKGVIDGNYNG